jgi:hypothetical protein
VGDAGERTALVSARTSGKPLSWGFPDCSKLSRAPTCVPLRVATGTYGSAVASQVAKRLCWKRRKALHWQGIAVRY